VRVRLDASCFVAPRSHWAKVCSRDGRPDCVNRKALAGVQPLHPRTPRAKREGPAARAAGRPPTVMGQVKKVRTKSNEETTPIMVPCSMTMT
jgi:hypothetical protein